MQYILDCVTLLLNVVLCFYLLYGKYPVRSPHMVKRILLITAAVISKALIEPGKLEAMEIIPLVRSAV